MIIILLLVVVVLIFRYSKEGMQCDINYLYLHPPWRDKLNRIDNDIECQNEIFSHYYTPLKIE